MTAEVVTSENRVEFMQERMRLDPVEPKPEPKAEPEPKAPVAEADPAPEPEGVTEEPEQKPKPKNPIGERISEVTEKRRQAEARAEAAERRAAEAEQRARDAEARLSPPKEPTPEFGPRPDPKDYEDAFKYAEDLAEWSTKKALSDNAKTAREEAAKAEAQKVVDAFQKRVAAFKAEQPDYETKLRDSGVTVEHAVVRDSIVESDLGPQILNHLADNPDVADKLNGMQPAAALRYLGRIEAQLEKPTTKPAENVVPIKSQRQAPKLPDPITPVSGGRAGADDKVDSSGEFTGTYAEFKALRAAGKL